MSISLVHFVSPAPRARTCPSWRTRPPAGGFAIRISQSARRQGGSNDSPNNPNWVCLAREFLTFGLFPFRVPWWTGTARSKSGPGLRELGRIAAKAADLKSGPGLRGGIAQPMHAASDPTRIVNQRCPAALRGPARCCSSFNAHWASRLGSVGRRGLPASHAARRCRSPLLGRSIPACRRPIRNPQSAIRNLPAGRRVESFYEMAGTAAHAA